MFLPLELWDQRSERSFHFSFERTTGQPINKMQIFLCCCSALAISVSSYFSNSNFELRGFLCCRLFVFVCAQLPFLVIVNLKKKIIQTFVKDDQADFIQGGLL